MKKRHYLTAAIFCFNPSQKFAVEGMRAVVDTGGLKIACVTTKQNGTRFDEVYERERTILDERVEAGGSFKEEENDSDEEDIESPSTVLASLPFAHLGSDAWDLNYFYFWTTSVAAVRKIYFDFVKGKVDQLRTAGSWEVEREKKDVSCCCEGAKEGDGKQDVWNSPPPAVCCFGLNIPKSAWSSAIFPVLIQANDNENTEVIEAWLRENLRQERAGMVWLEESCEWSIGNTANYAMAIAMRNGSNCRAFHRGEEQGNAEGAQVTAVRPSNLSVWRCRKRKGAGTKSLEIGFSGDSGTFVIERVGGRGIKVVTKLEEDIEGGGRKKELALTWEARKGGGVVIKAESIRSGEREAEEKKERDWVREERGGFEQRRHSFVVHYR